MRRSTKPSSPRSSSTRASVRELAPVALAGGALVLLAVGGEPWAYSVGIDFF